MVNPYKESSNSKKDQVAQMFNNIAWRYDFLNHFLSLGIDRIWRRKAINILRKESPKLILDVATGTGDFAIAAAKLKPERIEGIDIAVEMINKGIEKIKKKKLDHIIHLQEGDSEAIKFDKNSFDAIIIAFGVRNFENLLVGLKEMYRVLKPGGIAVILEFSKPKKFPVKQVYNLYFLRVLPLFGKLFSKDSNAYTYLPESVHSFPDGKNFLDILDEAEFVDYKQVRLSSGIASIYCGRKLKE